MRVLPAFAVAAVMCSSSAAAAQNKRSVLVMDMKSTVVDASSVQTISGMIAASVSKRPNLSVLTGEDVKKMAELEADKQTLGCDPSGQSCLAEIANAMGADLVLYGDVGKLGELYVVNLNLFDAGAAKPVDRQSVHSKAFDENFITQLDVTIRNLFVSITGEKALTPTTSVGAAAVPSIDFEALKSGGGLGGINIQAEQALEVAMDVQESKTATPAQKRDAWCKLAEVSGTNPYREPAHKACNEWTQYVTANENLTNTLATEYATLRDFLGLKRKTKEQKLEATDLFLSTYSRLADRQEVLAVQKARRELANDGHASLPTDGDADTILVDSCPGEAEDFDGDSDTDGCPEKSIGESLSQGAGEVGGAITILPLAFDKEPFLGWSASAMIHLGGDLKPTTPLAGFGLRVAWAPIEVGGNFYSDFDQAVYFGGYAGIQLFETPNQDFALLRPSFGVEAMNFPTLDDTSDPVFGAYAANTFRILFFQIRAQYRYAFAGFELPTHALTLELSVDMIKLFEEG